MKHGALGLAFVLLACSSPSSVERSSAANTALARAAYTFELKARSSEDPGDPSGTFQLPGGVFIKDMSPSLNGRGDVALDFLAFDGHQHVWAKDRIVYDVPDEKAVISATSIDDAGNVAFDVMGGSSGNGIYRYDAAAGTTRFYSSEPLGSEYWVGVSLTENGRIGCRAGTGESRYIVYVGPKDFTRLAVDVAGNPNSPYQYLFSPSFDDHDHAAAKVWLVSGGNEIRMFSPGQPAKTLVQDKEANPASTFEKLDNGAPLNNAGQVAFIAQVGGHRGVFRSDGTTTTQIAIEGKDDLAEVGWFNPVINDAGVVAFKGEDTKGNHTIWVGDGTKLQRLVTAGDALPSDKESSFALPETDWDPSNRITFGGGLAINARGQVVFIAALAQRTEKGTTRMGTGIYVATPAK